jgi:SAM-dependent methyltransferase
MSRTALERLRNLLRRSGVRGATAHLAAMTRGETDYKTTWNGEAHRGAHDAILTNATPETFETTGQGDAALVARFLRGDDVVLNIACGVGRVDKYLAPRVRELCAVDVSGEMIRRAAVRLAGPSNVRLREVGNRSSSRPSRRAASISSSPCSFSSTSSARMRFSTCATRTASSSPAAGS